MSDRLHSQNFPFGSQRFTVATWLKKSIIQTLNRTLPRNPEDTIVVAGSPRSGTTWLAELLRRLPGYKFLNEPLLLPNNPAAQEVGFEWRTHIAPTERRTETRRFFENVLSGRMPHGPLWHYQAASPMGRLLEHATRRKLVVKFCRAGRLLHWMNNRFSLRGIVLLIRHPCAVMASMLSHGGWDDENFRIKEQGMEAFGGQLPKAVEDRFASIFDEANSRLEVMTVTWSLDHYIPLIEYAEHGHPWILVPYERLVLAGEEELERVLSGLDAEMTGSIRSQLSVASAYASNDLKTTNKGKQLAKWRSRLTDPQIDRILEIVSAFGLDFYTRDLEPDYDRLMQFSS